MTHRALATGDSKPDIEVLHNLWGQRWRPFRWSSTFEPWSGKRGKYTIRGTLRGYSEFEVRVELNPGDDIERSMRLQTECMWPGCANLADPEPLALKVTQDYRYSNRYEVFSFCREHGCDAGAVCALMGKEPWGFYKEAIRRGILSDRVHLGGGTILHLSEPKSPAPQEQAYSSYARAAIVRHGGTWDPGQSIGVGGAGLDTSLASAVGGGGAGGGHSTHRYGAAIGGGGGGGASATLDRMAEEWSRDSVAFTEGELTRLYPERDEIRFTNAASGYPAPVHLTPADDGVLILPWGAVRRAHAGVPIELPVGFGLSEFRAYSRRALDLVDEMLRGGGLQESLGLYEECERRARRERAEAGAQAEALHAAACDARGSLDAKFKRERERLPPAPATPPGATRHWASFESGCNWED